MSRKRKCSKCKYFIEDAIEIHDGGMEVRGYSCSERKDIALLDKYTYWHGCQSFDGI